MPSILSDILGMSPSGYWPLADPTGPAAVDASGNGFTGVYGGSFGLGQYGVNPGEYACQFAPSGVVLAPVPFTGSGAQTFVFYASMNLVGTLYTNPWVVAAGDVNLNLRGWGVVGWADNQIAFRVGSHGTAGTPINLPVWNKWWHLYEATYDGSGTYSMGLDGTTPTTYRTSASMVATISGDQLMIAPGFPAVIAHVAYFNRLLTSLERTTLASHVPAWPFGPLPNYIGPTPAQQTALLSATDPVVLSLQASAGLTPDQQSELDLIRDSVRRTWP